MPASGCFPNLKVFNAQMSLDRDEEMTRKLFTSLPKLQELSVVGFIRNSLAQINIGILGKELKSVKVISSGEYLDLVVEIDAPQLEQLFLGDQYFGSYLVNNLPSIREVKFEFGSSLYNKEDYTHGLGPEDANLIDLLQHFLGARSLSVSAFPMLALSLTNGEPLAFPFLTRLDMTLCPCHLYVVVDWLQSTPNLASLILRSED